MLYTDLNAEVRSQIWNLLNENRWTEYDNFSIVLSEAISRTIILGRMPKLAPVLQKINTNFFKINKIPKNEFGIKLKPRLVYLVKSCKRQQKIGKQKSTKSGKRKDFSEEDQIETQRRQDHRCAKCGKILNIVEYDHKDGDRTNNHVSNCQALCPTCHGIKSVKNQIRSRK